MNTANNRKFLVCYESLQYGDDSKTLRIISEIEFSRIPVAPDGSRVDRLPHPRHIITRIGCNAASRIEAENSRKEYTRLIAEKYNVGLNWRENRWFVEQVRPTLL
jgi:hypothetical protein